MGIISNATKKILKISYTIAYAYNSIAMEEKRNENSEKMYAVNKNRRIKNPGK